MRRVIIEVDFSTDNIDDELLGELTEMLIIDIKRELPTTVEVSDITDKYMQQEKFFEKLGSDLADGEVV